MRLPVSVCDTPQLLDTFTDCVLRDGSTRAICTGWRAAGCVAETISAFLSAARRLARKRSNRSRRLCASELTADGAGFVSALVASPATLRTSATSSANFHQFFGSCTRAISTRASAVNAPVGYCSR